MQRNNTVLLCIALIVTVTICLIVLIVATRERNDEPRTDREAKRTTINREREDEIRTIEATIDDYETIIRQRYEILSNMERARKRMVDVMNDGKESIARQLTTITNKNETTRKRLLNLSILLSRIDVELKNLDIVRKIVEFKRRTKRYIENDQERNKYFETLYTNVPKRSFRFCPNVTPP